MKPPLTIPQTLAVLREHYPDGLACSACARLIASQGYAGREYTCAECLSDAREATKAFERLRGQPKRLTEAQLGAATAYCTWCRRWFNGRGMACVPCQTTQGNGWALPGEIPLAVKAPEIGQYGEDYPVQITPISAPNKLATSKTLKSAPAPKRAPLGLASRRLRKTRGRARQKEISQHVAA